MNPSSKSRGGKLCKDAICKQNYLARGACELMRERVHKTTKPKKKVRSWKAWAIISEGRYLRVKHYGACSWDQKSDAQMLMSSNDEVVSVTITENRPSGRRKGRL